MSTSGLGSKMHALISDLFPHYRSVTGDGVRRTLSDLQNYIPLIIHEVPSGTKAFDWIVPNEWSIRSAYIEKTDGSRLVDIADSNLHLVNGSCPIDTVLPWNELEPHIYACPSRPQAIPYRTTFFRENWGFCVPHTLKQQLSVCDDSYRAVVDSNFFPGSMTYGECTVRGESERSVLIYCHTCHPSLANDNLSGIAVATHLAQRLMHRHHFYTYRFVFAPATIGAITWLSINEDSIVPLVDHGIVLSLLGNDANFTYKQSRRGNAIIDQVATAAVKGRQGSIRPFSPFGYDERQFCSPGFNLPVCCLTRTPYAEFSEYHTSDDNLNFVKPDRLLESLNLCEQIFADLENNRDVNPTNSDVHRHSAKGRFPINKLPKCEPVLGKYNLYSGFGQSSDISLQNAILWVLNLSDGSHSIEQMVDRSKMTESQILNALNILCDVEIVSVS